MRRIGGLGISDDPILTASTDLSRERGRPFTRMGLCLNLFLFRLLGVLCEAFAPLRETL